MAQNITLLGANYPDVPAVQLPITGGGTATFSDTRSVTYNLTGGATASVSPSEVVAGQGFSVKLKAPAGYNLNGVTVTMGGVNVTSQVFTPDEAGGGGGITPSGTIQITTNGTHNVANYASADVNVPQSGITPTGTVHITENGTVDVTNYASANVNVSGDTFEMELKNLGWEVGAVNGTTGSSYEYRKQNNTARLRGVCLVSTANLPLKLSANWESSDWQIMCAEYGANGLGRTMFTTVLTSDGALPVAPYLAFVIRHVDGTTAMNVSDIITINPILTIDSTRLT